MTNKVVLLGWNRPITGRENMAIELLSMYTNLFEGAKKDRKIDSYETVLLDAPGQRLNGFILVRGEDKGIHELMQTDSWRENFSRAYLYLQDFQVITGATGPAFDDRIKIFRKMVTEIHK